MTRTNTTARNILIHLRGGLLGLLTLGLVLLPVETNAVPTDDQALFVATAGAAPNVMFVIDTSGSMKHIVWHEKYDEGDGWNSDCKPYFGSGWSGYEITSDTTLTVNCGGTRAIRIYADPALTAAGIRTSYSTDYLNWLFDSSQWDDEALDLGTDTESYECLNGGATFRKYKRSRETAAKNAIEDVICVARAKSMEVRFGVSRFRTSDGGFVVVPCESDSEVYALHGDAAGTTDAIRMTDTKSQVIHLSNRMDDLQPDGSTPLAETLFQIYTYFMSRIESERPSVTATRTECIATEIQRVCWWWWCWDEEVCTEWGEVTANTYFPEYEYETASGSYNNSTDADETWKIPDSPVLSSCQNNYVILLSDGEPTSDGFEGTGSLNQGFDDTDVLLGTDISCNQFGNCGSSTPAIEDIASKMHTQDMYPDASSAFTGMQNISLYTVGFNASDAANQRLINAAEVGGGKNFSTSDTKELVDKLVALVAEITAGEQSFAASSVPSSRQSLGSYFYTSYFKYSADDPFWEGHLMALNMSIGGGIFDKNWMCSLTPETPACRSGELMLEDLQASDNLSPTYREPIFDVGKVVTDPATRTLYVAKPRAFGANPNWPAAVGERITLLSPATTSALDFDILAPGSAMLFETALMRELNISAPAANTLAASASNDDIADALVEYIYGCDFGSVHYYGACVTRTNPDGAPNLIGDIFHSAPLLVSPPNGFGLGAAYQEFRADIGIKWRPTVIYVGANDGLLHAFKAGQWLCASGNPCLADERPITFDTSGEELFGFMPWPVRRTIKELPIDNGPERDHYFVDGSPVSSDVWINRNVDGSTDLPTGSVITDSNDKVKEQWRTVLIGGLRQGGRKLIEDMDAEIASGGAWEPRGSGYYALDVTNPDSSYYPGYLWEFPCELASTDLATPGCSNTSAALRSWDGTSYTIPTDVNSKNLAEYMGETWSDPEIHRVKVYGKGTTTVVDRWVAVFGAGYHPTGDPRHSNYDGSDDASTSRHGRAIFMVDITTGEILASRRFEHTAGAGGDLFDDAFDYAFASSATVDDADGDGYADTIYIGDLGGNIWRWDVSAVGYDVGVEEAQSEWPLVKFFESGGNRSFYYPPEVAIVPGSGKRWLVAATGNRSDIMEMGGNTDPADNDRVYAIDDITSYTSLPLTESSLFDATTLATSATVDGVKQQIALESGFFMITEEDEKFVTRIVVLNGVVTVGSFIPGSSGGCSQSGSAYYWEFYLASSFGVGHEDAIDDAGRKRSVGVGLPREPRPSFGADGDDQTGCPDSPPSGDPCACVSAVACDDSACGAGAMTMGGASGGGTSAQHTSGQCSDMPHLRTWREQ